MSSTTAGAEVRTAPRPSWKASARGAVALLLAAARRRPRLLGLLLALDVVLVVLHLARHARLASSWPAWLTARARLDVESGMAEQYGYAKVGAIVVGLVVLSGASDGAGRRLLRAWGATYAIVLVDDALGLHERGGSWFASRWRTGDGWVPAAQDMGEILTWAGLYAGPLVVLVVLHRASRPPARDRSGALWVAAVALALCAVVLDVAHAAAVGDASILLGAAEDGGELVVLTVTLCAVVGMSTEAGKSAGRARRPA